jgi:sugar (pentulose or hexulose) kinase
MSFLGIDLGTGSLKVAIVDESGCNLVARALRSGGAFA